MGSDFAIWLGIGWQGRDVYVMGSANVGKSAFITALLRECFLGFLHNASEFPWFILGIQFSEPPW
jgi:hypothetical protein